LIWNGGRSPAAGLPWRPRAMRRCGAGVEQGLRAAKDTRWVLCRLQREGRARPMFTECGRRKPLAEILNRWAMVAASRYPPA